jgi:chemotaxis response regulator CheB
MRITDVPLTAQAAPRSSARGVAIVASAGGIAALVELLRASIYPSSFPLFILQHMAPDAPSVLPKILRWQSGHDVDWAEHGQQPDAGRVYVCPPGCGMRIGAQGLELWRLPPAHRSWLDCPDMLFESVAARYQAGGVGIVLSGMIPVALDGLRAIRLQGGVTMAQSERTTSHFQMPSAAIDFAKVDLVLSPKRIADALFAFDNPPTEAA